LVVEGEGAMKGCGARAEAACRKEGGREGERGMSERREGGREGGKEGPDVPTMKTLPVRSIFR